MEGYSFALRSFLLVFGVSISVVTSKFCEIKHSWNLEKTILGHFSNQEIKKSSETQKRISLEMVFAGDISIVVRVQIPHRSIFQTIFTNKALIENSFLNETKNPIINF